MPFVNRWHELFELFWFNARSMFMLKNSKGEIKDFRPYKLVFCVQYYGSGKTTLGEQFFKQLKDPKVQKFFENKLKEGEHARLRGEWEALKAGLGSAKHLFVNAAAFPNIVQLLSSKLLKVPNKVAEHVEGDVAVCLVSYAAKQNGPVLVHFDEVGSHEGHNIQSVQRLVAEVWTQLHTMANDGGHVPAIYFLATGTSTEPFEVVGLSRGSPCGSHFLVLDMLKPEHVGEVRWWLTGDDLKSQVPVERRLKLNLLHDKEVGCYLDKALTDATGGAPRLLLYSLRALAYLECPLSSYPDIDTALDLVYANISKVSHEHIANGVVYPPPKAPSEDAFHFQHLVGSNSAGVVGWQMKFFGDTPFHMSTLSEEVPKCMTSNSEVFVIACTKYGSELLNVLDGADDKVVVLKAWSSDTAAVYTMVSSANKLLWRPETKGAHWYEFPSKDMTHLKPKGKLVTVRPGLEVVLPHPEVVTELVGSDLMSALQSPSADSAGLVIRRLDDILGRKRDAAAGTPVEPMAVDDVVIKVRLKGDAGAVVQVGFSRASASADIKEAILLGLGKQPGTVFRLRDAGDVIRSVDNQLKDGCTYSVELV